MRFKKNIYNRWSPTHKIFFWLTIITIILALVLGVPPLYRTLFPKSNEIVRLNFIAKYSCKYFDLNGEYIPSKTCDDDINLNEISNIQFEIGIANDGNVDMAIEQSKVKIELTNGVILRDEIIDYDEMQTPLVLVAGRSAKFHTKSIESDDLMLINKIGSQIENISLLIRPEIKYYKYEQGKVGQEYFFNQYMFCGNSSLTYSYFKPSCNPVFNDIQNES